MLLAEQRRRLKTPLRLEPEQNSPSMRRQTGVLRRRRVAWRGYLALLAELERQISSPGNATPPQDARFASGAVEPKTPEQPSSLGGEARPVAVHLAGLALGSSSGAVNLTASGAVAGLPGASGPQRGLGVN